MPKIITSLISEVYRMVYRMAGVRSERCMQADGPWVVRGWHSFPSLLTSFKHSGPRASVHGGRHGRAPMRANKALLGYQDGACGVHKRRDYD